MEPIGGPAFLAEERAPENSHDALQARANSFLSFAPHPSQNEASEGLSLLHFPQSIRLGAQFIEQGLRFLQVGGVRSPR